MQRYKKDCMNTTIIYVEILNEATPVWRATEAEVLADGMYRILTPDHYWPEDEEWEFIPGSIVRCEIKTLIHGDTPVPRLVAVERV
jgi:hypothetical protein